MRGKVNLNNNFLFTSLKIMSLEQNKLYLIKTADEKYENFKTENVGTTDQPDLQSQITISWQPDISNFEFCEIKQSKFEISKVYTIRDNKTRAFREINFFENSF